MSTAYISDLNSNETNPLLVSLRTYAEKHEIPIMMEDGIRFLSQMVRLKQAKRVLEIGTAIGYSAIYLAHYNDVHITTIERDEAMIKQAKANIETSGYGDQITLIEDDALDVDETSIEPVDVIFIDAAKAQSINFFNKYKSRLTPSGIIVADNLLFHGLLHKDDLSRSLAALVKKIDLFNRFVVEQDDFDTTLYEIGDGISLSIKKDVIE